MRSQNIYSSQKKIGYLVTSTKSKRTDNIGGDIIRNILEEDGYSVEVCRPDEINKYELVLHSIPSTYQVIDYLRAARVHGFDKRKSKILIGGFGVQNITAIEPYIDYAYYGRAHSDISRVVKTLMKNGDISDPHVYSVEQKNNVCINQAALCDRHFKETFTGCPNMCMFCHYAWARKPQGNSSGYVQHLLTGGGSPEIMWKDIFKLTKKPGRIRTAIDGFSEKLRYSYGKRISNEEIVEGINKLGSLKESSVVYQESLLGGVVNVAKKQCVTCLVYNIGHFPGETSDDWQEFAEVVTKAKPRERVIMIIHTTPFRPSILTPMQWESVQLWPEWSEMRELTVRDDEKVLCKYSYTLEGAFSHLSSVVIDRLKSPTDSILDGILKPGGNTSRERATYLLERHDAGRFCEEMPIDGPAPVPCLEGHVPNDKIRKIAEKLRKKRP